MNQRYCTECAKVVHRNGVCKYNWDRMFTCCPRHTTQRRERLNRERQSIRTDRGHRKKEVKMNPLILEFLTGHKPKPDGI